MAHARLSYQRAEELFTKASGDATPAPAPALRPDPRRRGRYRHVTDLSQQAMKLVIALNGGSTPLKAAQAGQPGSQGTCRAAMRRSSGWRRSGRS